MWFVFLSELSRVNSNRSVPSVKPDLVSQSSHSMRFESFCYFFACTISISSSNR
jgi:hypothetical protein